MFSKIPANITVTIKNVTLEDTGTAALITGYLDGNLILENVIFKDCTLRSGQKVGTVAGNISNSASLIMTNVKYENCYVEGYAEVGGIAGVVHSNRLNKKSDMADKSNDLGEVVKLENVDVSGIELKWVKEESTNNENIDIDGNYEIGDVYYHGLNTIYGATQNYFGLDITEHILKIL